MFIERINKHNLTEAPSPYEAIVCVVSVCMHAYMYVYACVYVCGIHVHVVCVCMLWCVCVCVLWCVTCGACSQ